MKWTELSFQTNDSFKVQVKSIKGHSTRKRKTQLKNPTPAQKKDKKYFAWDWQI